MTTQPFRTRSLKRTVVRRIASALLALAVLLTPAVASAHGMLVLGAVTAIPDPPLPGKPLVVTIDLQTSSKAPVEGAHLVGELRPEGRPGAAPTPVTFQEYKEPYGTYRAQLDALPAGTYTLTVRDRTYANENARADVTLRVGGSQPNGTLDFAFPPMSGGPRSVLRWLLWLVGLPVLTGVVVTILVLRSKRDERGAGERADDGDAVG